MSTDYFAEIWFFYKFYVDLFSGDAFMDPVVFGRRDEIQFCQSPCLPRCDAKRNLLVIDGDKRMMIHGFRESRDLINKPDENTSPFKFHLTNYRIN